MYVKYDILFCLVSHPHPGLWVALCMVNFFPQENGSITLTPPPPHTILRDRKLPGRIWSPPVIRMGACLVLVVKTIRKKADHCYVESTSFVNVGPTILPTKCQQLSIIAAVLPEVRLFRCSGLEQYAVDRSSWIRHSHSHCFWVTAGHHFYSFFNIRAFRDFRPTVAK